MNPKLQLRYILIIHVFTCGHFTAPGGKAAELDMNHLAKMDMKLAKLDMNLPAGLKTKWPVLLNMNQTYEKKHMSLAMEHSMQRGQPAVAKDEDEDLKVALEMSMQLDGNEVDEEEDEDELTQQAIAMSMEGIQAADVDIGKLLTDLTPL